jgi:hypothetical protein
MVERGECEGEEEKERGGELHDALPPPPTSHPVTTTTTTTTTTTFCCLETRTEIVYIFDCVVAYSSSVVGKQRGARYLIVTENAVVLVVGS